MSKRGDKVVRKRRSRFEASVQGKVWVFRWDPRTESLECWRKQTRQKHKVSAAQLTDAVIGQKTFDFK